MCKLHQMTRLLQATRWATRWANLIFTFWSCRKSGRPSGRQERSGPPSGRQSVQSSIWLWQMWSPLVLCLAFFISFNKAIITLKKTLFYWLLFSQIEHSPTYGQNKIYHEDKVSSKFRSLYFNEQNNPVKTLFYWRLFIFSHTEHSLTMVKFGLWLLLIEQSLEDKLDLCLILMSHN